MWFVDEKDREVLPDGEKSREYIQFCAGDPGDERWRRSDRFLKFDEASREEILPFVESIEGFDPMADVPVYLDMMKWNKAFMASLSKGGAAVDACHEIGFWIRASVKLYGCVTLIGMTPTVELLRNNS